MPTPASPSTGPTATYFQPIQEYFWHWAEDNSVVEWKNGTTIVYREELASLLTSLAPGGLPPLGAVLLLLAACNSSWQDSTDEILVLQGVANNLSHTLPPEDELRFYIRVATGFLDIVAELPPELRQGPAKEHLLREVLGPNERHVPAREAQQLAQQLSQPAELIDPAIFSPAPSLSSLLFRHDLMCFDRAARQFPTVHSLELRLRTGLDQLPEPLPEVPAPPPNPELPADLLAELAADAQTAGLARLVPHLRAALHLPQPARQAGDQPLGGVADLANRGPLDRLLLSELAQDDLSLLARLAHGEALYLRREAPPLPQPLPRVLLLDTTLQTWGLPHVVGLAAALALAPASPGRAAALAFALGGRLAQPLDLRTRPGVVAALGHLDPALHCGAALPALLPTLPTTAEAVLITEAQAARLPEFLAFLQAAPANLRFLLTVARTGELVLHELAGGRRTVLNTSQVDLENTLFAPRFVPRKAIPKTLDEVVLPAFFGQELPPLFFPTTSFRPLGNAVHYEAGRGALGVTQQLRVLYWPHDYLGALEALPMVEEGAYHFGFSTEHHRTIYLLVTQPNRGKPALLVLYTLRPWQNSWERVDLSEDPGATNSRGKVRYHKESFILEDSHRDLFVVDCQRPGIVLDQSTPLPASLATNPPRNYFNPGYGVLQKINRLAISKQGNLLLDNYELVASSATLLTWQLAGEPRQSSHPAEPAGTYPLATHSRVRLRRWVWPDGSEAFADSRGLLHLRSANAALPQLTVVLATGRATTAWEAGGRVCGWSYFTRLPTSPGLSPGVVLPADEFYRQYLQPFLDHLR